MDYNSPTSLDLTFYLWSMSFTSTTHISALRTLQGIFWEQRILCSSELKKVAILAIRIGERSGNLGKIFTWNLRMFVKFWDMSRFTHFWDHFQAECGEDFEWLEKLGNIDLKIFLFCLHFPPKFQYGSDWGIFLMNSVQQYENYAVLLLWLFVAIYAL